MKDPFKLIVSVFGCELVGLLGTPFTIAAIPTWYATLNKPFFAPPNWIFGPVWTLLYLLMGVAFYLIWKQGGKNEKVKIAGRFFLAQLGANLVWSPIFFWTKDAAGWTHGNYGDVGVDCFDDEKFLSALKASVLFTGAISPVG